MLRLDDLEVVLDADAGLVRAVDGLRLTIERGETFALVGESGCGKSMTALALMRLLPENARVQAGGVTLDGTDLLDLPEAAMRGIRGRRMGMIFQEPATSLNPVMRVGEQVIEVIEAHTPLRGAEARRKALEWLDRVGIPEAERRMDDYPFRLSGGQKQRVMIAMALAGEPDYLVADEPTTALDVTIQAQILELLERLQREQGMGLLLITHDLGVVARMAHRVALMYAGQIVEVASASEFFARPRHPYATLLLEALPDGTKRGRSLAAIGGSVPPLWERFRGCRFAPRCPVAAPRCAEEEPPPVELGGNEMVRCLRFVPGTVWPEPAAKAGSTLASAAVPMGASGGEGGGVLLEVEGLTVRFPIRAGLFQRVRGHHEAVRGVSFRIGVGRTLALVGESGCGKTTTGKAIVQLLRGQAEIRGKVLLEGLELSSIDGAALREVRRQVQIVFQDPFASLNPRLRVGEILEEGLISLCPEMDEAARGARVGELVEQVGLRADSLGRYPHEFSGGQRQRIAIARALAVKPRLLVCDEPTSALDVSVQAQILNLLRQLQERLGVSYLFITHNIGVVEYVADEVAVMTNGEIVESGPVERVLGAPAHEYTRTLLASVPKVNRGG